MIVARSVCRLFVNVRRLPAFVIAEPFIRDLGGRPTASAFVNEFSSQSLENVLYDIVQTENIHLNLRGGPFFKDIRLSAETQNNQSSLSWFNPVKFDRR